MTFLLDYIMIYQLRFTTFNPGFSRPLNVKSQFNFG